MNKVDASTKRCFSLNT